MSISFERFLTLTAALAAASAGMTGCGGDDDATAAPTGGTSAGKTSAGGAGAGKSGAASGGRSTGGTSAAGKGAGGRGGGAGISAGGSSGTSASGAAGEAPESGGAGAGAQGSGGSKTGGRGGVSGSENNGGESNAGVGGSLGGVPNGGGEAGDHSAGAGGAGVDEGPCFGDVGATDCFSLSAGDLPSDECSTGMNPPMRSCLYSQTLLRPGVIDGLGSCLVPITDPCTIGSADATDVCERRALRRACPNSEGADACANGIDLGGGNVLPSPTVVCTDGTLTQTNCTTALSAVTADALADVVACADPAGDYGHYFSGTCAQRLQFCVFPHAQIYP